MTKDQLLTSASTTDSGVAVVVRKQETGWSYMLATKVVPPTTASDIATASDAGTFAA